jgi:hypothetical protein
MRRITVRVKPGVGRNEVVPTDEDVLLVYTSAKPKGGEANEMVLELLAKYLHTPKSALSIRLGQTSREKLVEIDD